MISYKPSITNCPNCGAPLQGSVCPYCGTHFFDFTTLEDGKPCYISYLFEGNVLTAKAIPHAKELNVISDSVCVKAGANNFPYTLSRSVIFSVDYELISDETGVLYNITIKEREDDIIR